MKGKTPGDNGETLSPYSGRWVARIGSRVVGQGGTPIQALTAAKNSRYKESPQVDYMTTSEHLPFSYLFKKVISVFPQDKQIFLVGGAVRDALLGKKAHDLDFVVKRDAVQVARRAADALDAAFYVLDDQRDAARIIISDTEGGKRFIDVTAQRGDDIESDLRARDFTINSMAINTAHPQQLLDPLGGAADLQSKRLRTCSSSSMVDDPIRIIRGVRLAVSLGCRILPETQQLMRKAVPGLTTISNERLRDELFRIFNIAHPSKAIRILDALGIVPAIFPGLSALKGISQTNPQKEDVWTHTLSVVNKLEIIVAILTGKDKGKVTASYIPGLLRLRLGRFQEQIYDHLNKEHTPQRNQRQLLFLAALFHDVGKHITYKKEDSGRVRFKGHEEAGLPIVIERCMFLRLSRSEIQRMKVIMKNHLRPKILANNEGLPSNRNVYRYFHDLGSTGVDVCLLSLANVWAAYGPTLPQDMWKKQVNVNRALLEAWWEYKDEKLFPSPLLNGNDLIDKLHIEPGPTIGRLLDEINEAQVTGDIRNKEDAFKFARSIMGCPD